MENKNLFAKTFYTFFVNGLMALMIGAILPYLMSDYQLGYDLGGLLLSSHALGNFLASFAVSYLVIKLGRKKTIVLLSTLIAVGFLGIILTSNKVILVFMFLLTGLGRGSISNMDNSIINDAAVGQTAPLNILHTFFAVGAITSPFFASICISHGLSWKFVVGVGIIFAISAVVVYLLMDVDGIVHQEKQVSETISRPFYQNTYFYIAAGLLFFYLGFENSVNSWVVTYLKDTEIMSGTMAQNYLSLLWTVIILGRLTCAYVSKYIKKETLILVNCIFAAIFFTIFMFLTDAKLIFGCIIAMGFFLAGIYPTTISTIGAVLKGQSTAMAMLLAAGTLGGIVMTYITGAVAKRMGIHGGMVLIIVDVCIMVLFAILLKLKFKNKKVTDMN